MREKNYTINNNLKIELLKWHKNSNSGYTKAVTKSAMSEENLKILDDSIVLSYHDNYSKIPGSVYVYKINTENITFISYNSSREVVTIRGKGTLTLYNDRSLEKINKEEGVINLDIATEYEILMAYAENEKILKILENMTANFKIVR